MTALGLLPLIAHARPRDGASAPRFISLTPDLLRSVIPAPRFAALKEAMLGRAVDSLAGGSGWGMLDGGYVIGAGGVAPFWPGRGLAWMLPSIFARPRHLAHAVRFAVPWFDCLQADPAFARIEAVTPARFLQGCLFLKRLGFVCETSEPMKRYGPEGDYLQFARVVFEGAPGSASAQDGLTQEPGPARPRLRGDAA